MVSIVVLTAALALGIPGGFMLYEKDAAKSDPNPEHSWQVSGRTSARLVVNPCQKATLGRAGRTAAKTLIYTAVPDYSKSEQVILYSSRSAAKKAVRDLRAAVRACGSADYRYSYRPVRLGDEAVSVTGQAYQSKKPAIGGERAVVTRRANALIVYTVSGEWGKPAAADFKQQSKDTKRMLSKICRIADC
ncbi:sensor domain-containing protein [Nonomuraea sp. SBT364]|uniref:sensor domain-containing protein n=1 Tax=Nonomuraea sp. SBT364 TaxID=1580530 RepID=UPI00066BB0EF|nr:sensor domain-containing protein [Nonomuraea sp. SBT364]